MRVLSVVGARPQFVKLSPIDRALRAAGHTHVIVHTGQHYAPELSDSLFLDLQIPAPDLNLGIGSASHAVQTAQMMIGLETAFLEYDPDWILVYGDTNSTLAAAIAAVKLQRPLAHLEAGLRSYNRAMPEEHNRIVTDHVSDLLLAPTATAMAHLAEEGLGGRAVEVGDVMADVCLRVRDLVMNDPPSLPGAGFGKGPYAMATVHRAENTDNRERLSLILDNLASAPLPVILVAHPRLVDRAASFGLSLDRPGLLPIPSLTYSQMVYAVASSAGVITDSGGLQKEAYLLRIPCITVRTETEWPETLADGWNILDPDLELDVPGQFAQSHGRDRAMPFGDGRAAEHVVVALEKHETNRAPSLPRSL